MKRLAALIPVAALVFTVACGQTDAGITTSVKSKLAADDTVSAYQVDVDTQDGIVTLTGSVDTPAAREQAVTLARQTDGVTDVVDNIQVDNTAATTGRIDQGADAISEGAREAGEAAREGADAVGDGARRVGEGARDAVTPDRDN